MNREQIYENLKIKSELLKPLKKGIKKDDYSESIYSNLVSGASNQVLAAKTEALLQELESQAPLLSKDLKLKIVKAILDEEEPDSVAEQPQIDSDEGTTIRWVKLTVLFL